MKYFSAECIVGNTLDLRLPSQPLTITSITQAEKNDLERIQKVACKIILKDSYSNYDTTLKRLNIQNLSDRRAMLATRFASKCTEHEQF